jgi:hypothetical protein
LADVLIDVALLQWSISQELSVAPQWESALVRFQELLSVLDNFLGFFRQLIHPRGMRMQFGLPCLFNSV